MNELMNSRWSCILVEGWMNWWILDEVVYWLKDEWIDEYLMKSYIGWSMNELMNTWWSCILVEGWMNWWIDDEVVY